MLNKLGRRTGKGKRWTQERVHTARRNHWIPGQRRRKTDPEILTLSGAADGLIFELGLRPGASPLVRYRSGDIAAPRTEARPLARPQRAA